MVRSRADDSLLWIPHCTNPQKDWVKSYYNSCMFVFYLLVSTVVWSQLKAPWDPSNWPAGLWPCSRDCSGWLGSWMSTWKDWSVEQYRCGTCSLQETDVSWTKSASRFALLADSMLYTLGVSIWKLQQSTTPGSMLKQKHWDNKSCGKPNHEPSPTRLVARYTPISDYLGDPYYWIYDGLPHCMYIYIHYYIDRERERDHYGFWFPGIISPTCRMSRQLPRSFLAVGSGRSLAGTGSSFVAPFLHSDRTCGGTICSSRGLQNL